MFYQNYHGVDCFEIGIQQLIDYMGWKSYVRDDGWLPNCALGSGISCVTVGDYVVVNIACQFESIGKPYVSGCFSNFSDAAESARLLTMVEYDCMANRSYEFDMYFCYEVWHVVDDGDLWQLWDHDAKLSRVDAPVLLDERDIVGIQIYLTVDHELLWWLNVPGVGRVSFIWGLHNGELVEEYCISDWQGEQPTRLCDAFRYDWVTVEEMLAAAKAYEMLRDAGSLDGGGRVGAAC